MFGQTLAAVSLRLHHIDSLPAASSHRPIAFSRKGLIIGCRHSINNGGFLISAYSRQSYDSSPRSKAAKEGLRSFLAVESAGLSIRLKKWIKQTRCGQLFLVGISENL
jgi:hypothetical protein